MRIAFGDLPIGARFATQEYTFVHPLVCVKTADRKIRVLATGQTFDKSPGVYVDCIDSELRLAVLRAQQQVKDSV